MTQPQFLKKVTFSSLSELEKIEALAYYSNKYEGKNEFDAKIACEVISSLGFGKPNYSRLKNNLSKSKLFTKGSSSDLYKLHPKSIVDFEKRAETNGVFFTSNEVEISNSIIPEELYKNTRGYITKLALQINASYDHKIADGCAVLMRRLMEVLLILGYRYQQKEELIKDGSKDQFKNLTYIIDYTISNKVLQLQKDTLDVLHTFREFGNYSAHGIQYNCTIPEITQLKMSYRFAIEDLLYSSGVKK